MRRIPSLDGLRAVAISLVCLSHLSYLKDHPTHDFSSLGPLGVRIFFVISGMLITRLLLEEREHSGGVSLKGFYIRRTVRIFPAMWFYVAVMAALSAAGVIALHHHDILHALTYTINYFPERSWYLGHIWSLSVEEQFYLLWPLVLCFAPPRWGIRAALVAICLAPLLRLGMLFVSTQTPYFEWFPTTCDSIAMGCLLSLLPPDGRWKRLAARIAAARWFIVVPTLVFVVNLLRRHAEGRLMVSEKNRLAFMFLDTVGTIMMNGGIALTILHVTNYPRDIFGRILNAPPVVWLGKISYSLYLWQMPFLNHDASSWITRTPVNLVASVCAACFSYYLIENPLQRLRKRLGWGGERRSKAADPLAAVATEAVS